MGFFKKIFKPVSKVLDKIIPNEIKPALPYLASFAPFYGPTSGLMGQDMLRRALISGGLNVGAQLAQEGNEGEINALSAGLGALSGAMTAPGAADTFAGMTTKGRLADQSIIGSQARMDMANRGLLTQGKDFAFSNLAKGSEFIEKGLASNKLMDKAAVYALPTATATGTVMEASARQLEKQNAIDEALAAAEGMADSAGRAAAIRNAMNAYGFFTDEEIDDTIFSAGYADGGAVGIMNAKRGLVDGPGGYSGDWITKKSKNWINKKKKFDLSDLESLQDDDDDEEKDNEGMKWIQKKDSSGSNKWIQKKADGGRVGLRFGGIGDAVENIEDEEIKESAKFAMNDMDIPIMDLVEEFEITFKRKPNSLEELKQFYKDRYEYKGPGDVKMQEEIKEKVVMEAKDGGLMNLGGKEMDMRGGGFIPIGKKERADDVPARLSKNEFVMTADAVRAAGGGSVNEGAKRMYETMNKLEARA